MVNSLVITLREVLEAALIIGVFIGYLKKIGREDMLKYTYIGILFAVLGSVAGAFLFNMIGFDVDNALFEGIMKFVAAAFVLSLVVWIQKANKDLKRNIENNVKSIVSRTDKTLQSIGILLFTFVMILREGLEIIIFLITSSSGFKIDALAGFTLGLVLAVSLAFLLFKGVLKMNLQNFFKITSVALLILTFKLLFGALHEFEEVGLLALGIFEEFIEEFSKSKIVDGIILLLLFIPVINGFIIKNGQKEVNKTH